MTSEEAVFKLRNMRNQQVEVDLADQRVSGRLTGMPKMVGVDAEFELVEPFSGKPISYSGRVLAVREWRPGS